MMQINYLDTRLSEIMQDLGVTTLEAAEAKLDLLEKKGEIENEGEKINYCQA